jgi:hypothetical protein
MQCPQLLEFYGSNETTHRWCTVLRAEIVGQASSLLRTSVITKLRCNGRSGTVHNVLTRLHLSLSVCVLHG